VAGIYIHVPFCKKRCNYCDFYKTTNTTLIVDYLNALSKEISRKKNYFSFEKPLNTGIIENIETIYFGGGTPSLLSLHDIEIIFKQLFSTFQISDTAEITFEINPDDVTFDFINGLKSIGVNRLSMGLQSFNDAYLKLMNRRHDSQQAFSSIETSIKAGITNLSIDLIYGLPEMNMSIWEQTLKTALKLSVQHLSAYHLTYENGTVFYDWLTNGKLKEIPEDTSFHQFEMLHNMAEDTGFEHYEISNFAKADNYSKHNSNYWKGIPYLGLGPSAHSYNGISRQWNVADIFGYCNAMNKGENAWKKEILTENNKINEFIMIRLRTKAGIDLDEFKNIFGITSQKCLLHSIQSFLITGDASIIENKLSLTLKGWFISDKIISALMQTS